MDTHMKGCRGANTQGAVVSSITAGAKFGDAALVTKEIFRTDGASSGLGPIPSMPGIGKKFPLLIEIVGNIITAFNGTSPGFSLTETNLDDTGSVTIIANLAAFT